MSGAFDPERIGSAMIAAFEAEVTKIAEEEAVAAGKRVEERVRRLVPSIAAAMHDHYSMERIGPDLLIKVKIEAA